MDPQTQIPQPLPPQQQEPEGSPPLNNAYPQTPLDLSDRPRFPDEQFMPEYATAEAPDWRPPQILTTTVIFLFLALSSTGSMIAGADTGSYAQVVVTSDTLSPKTFDDENNAVAMATATPTPTPTASVVPVPQKSTGSIPVVTHSTTPVHSQSPPPPPPPPSKPASGYYDGTYSSSARYSVPGSTESIGVTVVLANGIISDVSISQNPTNGTSATYQSRFASGYKSHVVGQSIKSLSLGRVSGASLTPNGFNSAISSISSKAAA